MAEGKKIFKKVIFYPIPENNQSVRFSLEIHEEAQLLNIDTRMGKPRLWAIADTSRNKIFRDFIQYGNNEEVGEMNLRYMGSYQLGNLHTHHVFEIPK
jgi:hypothetical protein